MDTDKIEAENKLRDFANKHKSSGDGVPTYLSVEPKIFNEIGNWLKIVGQDGIKYGGGTNGIGTQHTDMIWYMIDGITLSIQVGENLEKAGEKLLDDF